MGSAPSAGVHRPRHDRHPLLGRVPQPTIRGWAFLVSGLVLLVAMEALQRREFSFVALFLIAMPVIAAVGVSLTRVRYDIERVFEPELAAAGTVVTVRLIVRNWGMFSGPEAAWFDAAAVPLESSPRSVFRRMPAFRSSPPDTPLAVSLTYPLSADYRGQHRIGPFVLLLSDPFGMVVRRVPIGGSDVLTVTPSTVSLPRGAVRLATGSGSAQSSRQLGGAGEQDVISRKYQTGDSMRRVNWAASARFGELMVRQDDQQSDQHALVIIDTAGESYGEEMQPASDDGDEDELEWGLFPARGDGAADRGAASADRFAFSPAFEWAVSTGTSLGLHLLGEGFHLRVIDSRDALVRHELATGGRNTVAEASRFDPHSGEEPLLLHAARLSLTEAHEVDFRQAVSRAEAGVSDLPPLFAVVGQLGAASARSLAAAARLSSGAVAIIVTPPLGRRATVPAWASTLQSLLEDSGWIAQCVASDESPTAAWGSVNGERVTL